ncbi:MAG: SMP-30/gluconolactonase/LRE family protein [Caulobacterales bacterium]
MKITRLNIPSLVVGESPIWDSESNLLYLVDILGHKALSYDVKSDTAQTWDMPGPIGALVLRKSGGAIVAVKQGIYGFDPASGGLDPIAKIERADSVQFNDGKVDHRGRFMVCTLSLDRNAGNIGELYRLDADQKLHVLDEGIGVGNGPCWSPDGKTFYFADTRIKKIYAYDYDEATGGVSNRRVFADTTEIGGEPDGATVDRDGLLWMTVSQSYKIVVYRPDGKIERTIEMPVSLPASLTFGGDNLDRLFVTTIDPAPAYNMPELGEGGGTYVIDGLGARGIEEPRYAG